MSSVQQKLSQLRDRMKSEGLDFYIIPSSDPHMSEYVAPCWGDRVYMSGFDGSAGVLVVSLTDAGLWTDSRYYLQAEEQLAESSISMQKYKDRFKPEYLNWIISNGKEGDVLGGDGFDISHADAEVYREILDAEGISTSFGYDLVGDLWEGKPGMPQSEVTRLDIKYAGKSTSDKVGEVRAWMKDIDVDGYLITALDEIAWLLNIRGQDVDFNPVVVAYVFVSQSEILLFSDDSRYPDAVKQSLVADGVTMRTYTDVLPYLHTREREDIIAIDEAKCNSAVFNAINCEVEHHQSKVEELKAIKNPIEIANIREVMIKDGLALASVFKWLEDTLTTRDVSEVEFAKVIASSRNRQPGYRGESFPAIVGYKDNGAIIHYHGEEGKCKMISNEGMLLCDSGGQYLEGTTDITRTICFTEPSAEQKLHYTLVLKGFIDLAKMTYPKGTTGAHMDVLARHHLWQHGLNYGHGTGHGVGYYLNVHEGPHGIGGISSSRCLVPFKPGMVVTNEPGYYLTGAYGIRIENVLVCQKDEDHEGFYKFEDLTLFPISTKLIDRSIFTATEVEWLNQYHAHVLDKLGPQLEGELKLWMEDKCKAI